MDIRKLTISRNSYRKTEKSLGLYPCFLESGFHILYFIFPTLHPQNQET